MREIVLFAVVVVLSLIALVRPKIGIFAYVWFALMRPDILAYSRGLFPHSLLIALSTIVGSLRYFNFFPSLLRNSITRNLLMLQIPLIASVLFAVNPSLTYQPFGQYERMIAMVLLIPLLIRTEQDLHILFLVITFSMGFIAAKFGAYGILHGGVNYSHGFGGMISDNNALACACVMIVPFCWYLRTRTTSTLLRLAYVGLILLCTSTVVMTTSRAGSLALATTFLLIALRARRKLPVLLLLATMAVPSIYLISDAYLSRMETLKDPRAESSANSRFVMAAAAIEVWKTSPLIGVGFGGTNFMALEHPYVADALDETLRVHNTYLEILVDSGVFALLLYLILLFGTIRTLQKNVRACRSHLPGHEIYPIIMQLSLIAFAQYGLTGSKEHYDFTYIILGCAASWQVIQRDLLNAPAQVSEASPEIVTATAPEDAAVLDPHAS